MSVEMIKQQALLEKLLKKIENKECADCRTKSPSWASILFGTFICIRCSGFHRELSTSYAKVKSVDLDKWPNGVAELYTKINNNVANKYWEYKLEDNDINFKKLKDDDNYLRDYIFDKYQRKRWAAKGKCPMTRLYEGEDISNINYNDNLSKQSSSSSTKNDKKDVDIKKTFSSKSNVSNGIKEKTNDLKISEVTDDIFNFDYNKGNGNGNEQKYKFGFIDKNKSNENQTLSSTSKTNDCKSITDDIFNFSTKKEETKPKDEFDFGFETKDDKLSKLLCQIDGNNNNDSSKNNVKGNNSTNDIFNMMNHNNNINNGNLDYQKYLANNINFNATNINVNNNYYNSFNLGSNMNNMNQGFNNNYGYNKSNNNTFNNSYFDNNQYSNVNQTQGKTLNKNQDPNSKIQLNYNKIEYCKNSKSSNDLFGDFQDLKKKDSYTNGNKKGDPFSDLLKL